MELQTQMTSLPLQCQAAFANRAVRRGELVIGRAHNLGCGESDRRRSTCLP